MDYLNLVSQKLCCKFVGSIYTNKKARKLFTDPNIWREITESMRLDYSKALNNGLPFQKILTPDDRADMQTFFYNAVIDAIYPDDNRHKDNYYKDLLSYTIKVNKEMVFHVSNDSCLLVVDDITFYNYPNDITLFVISVHCDGCNLNTFTQCANYIRDIEHYNVDIVTPEFLALYNPILRLYNTSCEANYKIKLDDVRLYYNFLHKANKLKSYIIMRLTPESEAFLSDEYSRRHLLYDVATLSPIGAAVNSESNFKPSIPYYNKLMDNNLIECFDNWTAISLVDSFCCIMAPTNNNSFDYQYNKNWAEYYFEYLFLNVLFVKVFMLDANDRFVANRTNAQFYKLVCEIDRIFNHYNVSYNFLPDLVYKKIRVGMEIDDELQAIKSQIDNYENRNERAREKKLNITIAVLTVLTLSSVLNDGWEFLNKFLGYEWVTNPLVYIALALIIALAVLAIRYIYR